MIRDITSSTSGVVKVNVLARDSRATDSRFIDGLILSVPAHPLKRYFARIIALHP